MAWAASGKSQKPFCSIGDCIVHKGFPPDGNPYGCRAPKDPRQPDVQPYSRPSGLSGIDRRDALHAFKHGEDTSEFTFWYAPCGGGAFQIVNPAVVLWDGGASDHETARAFAHGHP